ncbi:MAG: HD domain-containing protein [Bacteroidales bacterium]|jgi:predicted metal-dependent HD superfamily phosphohydrolase|nr:HD domain-containing protein [Bacteroidales bacterium]MDD4085764.1 HD domain-containing protein [Bacteroidales bacterium]MDY0084369.1 HD domain-containing protein [Bacteroidales bacterium]
MQLNSLKNTIEKLILSREDDQLLYHNLAHTLDVLEAAERLITHTGVDTETALLIRAAALLHETGMTVSPKNHEEASVEIAKKLLPNQGFNTDQILRIAELILATKMPQKPFDLASKIICDADLDYLGRTDYFIIAHKLRLEWILRDGFTDDLTEWYQTQIEFLESHQYFTVAAKNLREKVKQHNLFLIKKLLNSSS